MVQSFLGHHEEACESLDQACRRNPVPHMFILFAKTLMKAKRFEVNLCLKFVYIQCKEHNIVAILFFINLNPSHKTFCESQDNVRRSDIPNGSGDCLELLVPSGRPTAILTHSKRGRDLHRQVEAALHWCSTKRRFAPSPAASVCCLFVVTPSLPRDGGTA